MTQTSNKVHPVLLCGGSGTRLWPVSRKSYPKQFVPLTENTSLFQSTVNRLTGDQFHKPLILTNSEFRFIVTEQMMAIGQDPSEVLIEPHSRNTAPAILAAALHIEKSHPDSLMLVAPSDHLIRDVSAFTDAVSTGTQAALSGKIVTFGINPTRPETGYGYLHTSDSDPSTNIRDLNGFIEKPDLAKALTLYNDPNYLWNAGIFLFSTQTLIKAFEHHAPDLLATVKTAVDTATNDLGFTRLNPDAWSQTEDISIDYAVMEKADNLCVVPMDGGWSDLGDWESVWRDSPKSDTGTTTNANATEIDCYDSLLFAASDRQQLVGLGLDNIIAVAMPDAVLVADKSRAQDVKLAVSSLQAQGRIQAETFPRSHRPWGWFESLVISDRFQVKRIVVHPGAALSLQSHMHRSEHWIVVAGTAKVTIGDEVQLLSENQSTYVPVGTTHRLENPGKLPIVMIEVQTGAYLAEDDIVRYDDEYARN